MKILFGQNPQQAARKIAAVPEVAAAEYMEAEPAAFAEAIEADPQEAAEEEYSAAADYHQFLRWDSFLPQQFPFHP
jgi:hypothetical protein